ncbi:MAG: hypothetical protein IMX00_06520 [Limnochordales bacterium]|nr:hypothetical protein [Limnochordales bacterium]
MEIGVKTRIGKIRRMAIAGLAASLALLAAACGGEEQQVSADLALGAGQSQQQTVEGSLERLNGEKTEVILVGPSEEERQQAEQTKRKVAPVILEKVVVTVSLQAERVEKLREDGSAVAVTLQNPQLNELQEVFDASPGGQLQVEKTWEFGPDSMLRSLTGDWKISFDATDLRNVKYTITVSAVRS